MLEKEIRMINLMMKESMPQKLYLASLVVTLITNIIVIKIMTIITRVSSAGKARTLWPTQVRLSMRASWRWEQSTRGRINFIIRMMDLYTIKIFQGGDRQKEAKGALRCPLWWSSYRLQSEPSCELSQSVSSSLQISPYFCKYHHHLCKYMHHHQYSFQINNQY